MIDFSKRRQDRAKAEKVDVQQMAVAELMAWGWEAMDAMLVVGMLKPEDDKTEAKHAALTYTSNEAFDKLYKKRGKQLRNGAVLDEYQKLHPTPGSQGDGRGPKRADGTYTERKLWQGDVAPVTDEEILASMWETIQKLDPKDPKRVDLLDKYDKLKRRQGVGEDDTTIHFYLPRPECDTCPFRGNHVINEPELEESEEEEEERPYYAPKPGYTKNGKKIGRPPKRHYKKREKKVIAGDAPKEEL